MDRLLATLVLGLGILAFVFHLIAFSTQGWFMIDGSYSVTNVSDVDSSNGLLQLLGKLDIQSGNGKPEGDKGPKPGEMMALGRPMRPKFADSDTTGDLDKVISRRSIQDDIVPVLENIDGNTQQQSQVNKDGVTNLDKSNPINSLVPVGNSGAALPDNLASNKASVQDISNNGKESESDGSNNGSSRLPNADGNTPLTDGADISKSRIFLRDDVVPSRDSPDTSDSGESIDNVNPHLPPISDMAKSPIGIDEIPKSNEPINNGGVASPDKDAADTSRNPTDDGGISYPGGPSNNGDTNKAPPRIPTDNGDTNNAPPRIPIDDGGIPYPDKSSDNGDTNNAPPRIPIDDGGIPFPDENGAQSDQTRKPESGGGKVSFPDRPDDKPSRGPGDGEVIFPNKPGGRPLPRPLPTKKPETTKLTNPVNPDGRPVPPMQRPLPTNKPGEKITFPNKPGGRPLPGGGKFTFPNKAGGKELFTRKPDSGKVTFPNKPTGRPGRTQPNDASLSQGLYMTWKFSFGLWSSNLCIETECEFVTLNGGFLFLQKAMPLIAANGENIYILRKCISISTFNS